MATTVSSSTSSSPAAAAADAAMKKLNDEIKRVRDQLRNDGAPARPTVEEFRKDIRKSPFTTRQAASDIGILIKNTSRINVISTLNKGDPVDFYKFRVTNTGEAGIGTIGDDKLRFQILSKNGAVVADSGQESGIERENYDKLTNGNLPLQAGEYVLRVSRKDGVSQREGVNYAAQLSMGSFKKDYDTVARPPRAGDEYASANSPALDNLIGMFGSYTSMLQSLGPIGQPATQKLTGTLFSGSF